MIKIFVLLTIMDITLSVDPRNNIFLELMNMSRNALFAGKNVCMPHAPSVGAGIPWVAHSISKCDTCTLFDHHTSGLYNKDTCHNVTIPPASSCCIPGLPSCNLTSATPIMTDLLMPRMFYWCMENYAPASTTLGEIPRERCSFVIEGRTEFNVYVTTSDKKEENELKECLYGNPSLPKLFAINQWCMIPPPTGTLWDFCLQHPTQPIQWQVHPGLCPTSHQRKYTLHLKFSTSTKFSFYQQRWLHSRTHLCTNVVVKNSWSINPIIWCHAGSRSSQKPVGFCTEIGQ